MEKPSSAILIADDEPALLKIMTQYLRRLGYEVDAFETGIDAWKEFQSRPFAYRLFIADATLTDGGPEDLLARMRELNPGIAFLISSGYPVDISEFRPELQTRIAFLQKPFTPRMLADAVSNLMARTAGG